MTRKVGVSVAIAEGRSLENGYFVSEPLEKNLLDRGGRELTNDTDRLRNTPISFVMWLKYSLLP